MNLPCSARDSIPSVCNFTSMQCCSETLGTAVFLSVNNTDSNTAVGIDTTAIVLCYEARDLFNSNASIPWSDAECNSTRLGIEASAGDSCSCVWEDQEQNEAPTSAPRSISFAPIGFAASPMPSTPTILSILPSLETSILPSLETSVLPSLDVSELPSSIPSYIPSSVPSDSTSTLDRDLSLLPSLEISTLPSFEISMLPSSVPSSVPSDTPTLLLVAPIVPNHDIDIESESPTAAFPASRATLPEQEPYASSNAGHNNKSMILSTKAVFIHVMVAILLFF